MQHFFVDTVIIIEISILLIYLVRIDMMLCCDLISKFLSCLFVWKISNIVFEFLIFLRLFQSGIYPRISLIKMVDSFNLLLIFKDSKIFLNLLSQDRILDIWLLCFLRKIWLLFLQILNLNLCNSNSLLLSLIR